MIASLEICRRTRTIWRPQTRPWAAGTPGARGTRRHSALPTSRLGALAESFLVLPQSASTRLGCGDQQAPVTGGLRSQGSSPLLQCVLWSSGPQHSSLCAPAPDSRRLSAGTFCSLVLLQRQGGKSREQSRAPATNCSSPEWTYSTFAGLLLAKEV